MREMPCPRAVREGGRIVNVAVVHAVGVNADGYRETLGIDVIATEDGARVDCVPAWAGRPWPVRGAAGDLRCPRWATGPLPDPGRAQGRPAPRKGPFDSVGVSALAAPFHHLRVEGCEMFNKHAASGDWRHIDNGRVTCPLAGDVDIDRCSSCSHLRRLAESGDSTFIVCLPPRSIFGGESSMRVGI